MARNSVTGRAVRKIILEQSKRANVGHIGSALSVADIMAALFSGPLHEVPAQVGIRNRFVLSKGHAALCLYAALHLCGRLTLEDLNTFCADGSAVGVHPESTLPGIDFSTGSLGQGLSFAVGAALAAKLEGSDRRTFALMSDAECNEGAVWEAAMFAAHHRLSGLVALIDQNGQQALGYTRDVLDTEPLQEKWISFGWDAVTVDGHDTQELADALSAAPGAAPRILICRTVFGKGVSFMEGQIAWHYLPMNEDQFGQAMKEVG